MRRRFTDITRAFRTLEFSELGRLSAAEFAAAAKGEDMGRAPINGRIPVIAQTTPYQDTTPLS